MWFKQVLAYQFELDEQVDWKELLSAEALKPCPPHARSIYGWSPVFEQELVQDIAGCSLIAFGKEERILPKGVIKRHLEERIQKIEAEQGRDIKRSERSRMAEDIEFELLPKAFCLQKTVLGLIDHVSKRLYINTSSANQASSFAELLRKSVPGLHIAPIDFPEKLAIRLAQWINDPSSLPANFALASGCLLFALEDEKKQFNCKGYELPADEISSLLSQGLAAAELSLIWNERIQFTLTQDLILKRVKSLDYLLDEFNETQELEDERSQRDAALTILSGELRALKNDILSAVR